MPSTCVIALLLMINWIPGCSLQLEEVSSYVIIVQVRGTQGHLDYKGFTDVAVH